MRRRIAGLLVLSWALTAQPAHALNWRVVQLEDEFTDVRVCRVEPGGAFSRAFARGLTGAFRTLHFFAENRNGEVRAGFMSEPLLPIPGDIQIRVDDDPLIAITAADTPLDAAPSINLPDTPGLTAEGQATMDQAIRQSLAVASPYRLLVGERAIGLLQDIVSGAEVRWRVIGVNAAVSQTGEIRNRGLSDALAECGITLATQRDERLEN